MRFAFFAFAILASSPALANQCRTDKIGFTQADGCQNDGSVEFCLPANDASLLATVQNISPLIECSQGSAGRARCDRNTELLCFLPTRTDLFCGPAICAADGSLYDQGWDQVCELATLDAIRAIVPTWFE